MSVSSSQCPSCGQGVSPSASRCPACSELLSNYKVCPQCMERVQSRASMCRYCHFEFPNAAVEIPATSLEAVLSAQHLGDGDAESPDATPGEVDFTVGATALGSLVCNHSVTGLLRPAELRVTSQEIMLKSWSFFGMRSMEQRIPTSRISSVSLVLGIAWASIIVETFGGGQSDYEIAGLEKHEARDMVDILEQHVLHSAQVSQVRVSEVGVGAGARSISDQD